MTQPEQTPAQDLEQIVQLQKRAIEFAEAGMMDEAIESATVSIGLLEETAPDNLLLKAKLMQNTSRVFLYAGDLEKAEAISAEGIALLRSLPTCPNDVLANGLLNLSSILYAKNDFDGAAEALADATIRWEQEAGRESAQVADCLNNLARIREEQGDHIAGAKLHQQVIDIKTAVYGDHEQTAYSWMSKGIALMGAKDFAEAHTALAEAVACCTRAGCLETEVGKACQHNLTLCEQQQA